MYDYDVLVTKTGQLHIQAESKEEAYTMISNMSNQEIESAVCTSDWQCTGVQNVKPVEFYYQITLPQKGQIFFRALENLQDEESIIALALDKGLINEVSSCSCAVQHNRETYQSKIVDYLYTKMCQERDKFQEWIQTQPPEYIYNHCGDIQFYEDILWIMEEIAADDEFDLASIEKLITLEKPIEKLNSYYFKVDFDNMNNQLMNLINSAISWQ